MSLINKMLKDLESRDGQTPASPQTILGGLRPAPTRQTRPRIVILLLLLIAAALGVGIWFRPVPHKSRVTRHTAKLPKRMRSVVTRTSSPVTVAASSHRSPAAASRLRHQHTAKVPALTVRAAPAVAPPISRQTHAKRRPQPASVPIKRTAVALTPPEKARLLYGRAILRLESGHRDQAKTLLRRALAADAHALHPRLLLAGLAIQGHHYHKARALLVHGLVLRPHALGEAMLLAQVDLHFGQAMTAVATLAPFAADSGARESYVALYGSAALRAGRNSLAASIYRSGVARYPHSGVLWAGLGIAQAARGNSVAARRAFHAALHCPLNAVVSDFIKRQLAQLR